MEALFPGKPCGGCDGGNRSETAQRKGEERDVALEEKGTVLSQRETSNSTPVPNKGRGKC